MAVNESTRLKFISPGVVAQLVEGSLPTSELRTSNPNIRKKISIKLILEEEKTKIKNKRLVMAHLHKRKFPTRYEKFWVSLGTDKFTRVSRNASGIL